MVDRSHSSAGEGVNICPDVAIHPLLQTTGLAPKKVLNALNIRIFHDQSVMEVFCDDRTCLTTRVYTESTGLYGIRLFAEGFSDEDRGILAEFCGTVWDGLSAHSRFP